MNYLKPALILLTTGLLTACPDLGIEYKDKNETIEVNYYKQPCSDTSASLCFSVKDKNSGDAYAVFNNLSGFSAYQWGEYHTIKVETSFAKNGKADSYRFISLEKSTANDNAFSMTLHSKSGIISAADSDKTSWTLGGEKTFSSSAEQGAAINQAIADNQVLQLEFTAADDQLTLNKVLCAAAENDFASECEGVSQAQWTVRHFQSDCNYNDPRLCLVYRTNSSDDWELLRTTSSAIRDFEPQWGNQYQIQVEKTLSAGGQLVSARLKENDENPTAVTGSSNTFLFVLNAANLPAADSDNKIALYDGGQLMLCDSRCSDINGARDDDHMLLLRGYVESGEVVVQALVCNENRGSDFDDCVADQADDISWWPPSA